MCICSSLPHPAPQHQSQELDRTPKALIPKPLHLQPALHGGLLPFLSLHVSPLAIAMCHSLLSFPFSDLTPSGAPRWKLGLASWFTSSLILNPHYQACSGPSVNQQACFHQHVVLADFWEGYGCACPEVFTSWFPVRMIKTSFHRELKKDDPARALGQKTEFPGCFSAL